jgi:hypothetical protein
LPLTNGGSVAMFPLGSIEQDRAVLRQLFA